MITETLKGKRLCRLADMKTYRDWDYRQRNFERRMKIKALEFSGVNSESPEIKKILDDDREDFYATAYGYLMEH